MKKKKMPYLYKKLLELMKNDSFEGEAENVKNIEIMVGRRFRISKGDLRICLGEMKERYGEIKTKRNRHGKTLTF